LTLDSLTIDAGGWRLQAAGWRLLNPLLRFPALETPMLRFTAETL
jgi:hypothetical protein